MKVAKLKEMYHLSIPVRLFPKGRGKKWIDTRIGLIDEKYLDRKVDEIWDGGENGIEVILKKKK